MTNKPLLAETYTSKSKKAKTSSFGAFVKYLQEKETNRKAEAASLSTPKTNMQAAIVMVKEKFTDLTTQQKYKVQMYFIEHPAKSEGFVMMDLECQQMFIRDILNGDVNTNAV